MSGWTKRSDGVHAVLFDLGNTLVRYYTRDEFPPILRRSLEEIVAYLCRVRWPGAAALEMDRLERHAHKLNTESDDGRVRPLEERLAELFGGTATPLPGALIGTMAERFLAPIFATAQLDPEAIPTLATLKAAGLKTAIVSNTPWGSASAAWRAELARLGLLEHVDAAVFCMDVGWRKPAPALFEHALATLGVAAERTLFVGDDPEWDIAGAQRAGLAPVLLGDAASAPEGCRVIPRLADVVTLVQRD